jgi:hypothetical protein
MNRKVIIEDFNSVTGWTALNTDCTNVAISTDHFMVPPAAVEFDKANGAANTTTAMIYKVRTAAEDLDVLSRCGFCPSDYVCWSVYASALTNIASAEVRLGTDASNYLKWTFADSTMTAGWSFCYARMGSATVAGNGLNINNLAYVLVGLNFDAETDTLADILVDHLFVAPASYLAL